MNATKILGRVLAVLLAAAIVVTIWTTPGVYWLHLQIDNRHYDVTGGTVIILLLLAGVGAIELIVPVLGWLWDQGMPWLKVAAATLPGMTRGEYFAIIAVVFGFAGATAGVVAQQFPGRQAFLVALPFAAGLAGGLIAVVARSRRRQAHDAAHAPAVGAVDADGVS